MSTLLSFGQCQFEDAVEEVLDAFARALGNMPVIEEAEVSFLLFLSCEKDHPGDFHEFLAYVPPSTRGTVKRRKYYWSTHLWNGVSSTWLGLHWGRSRLEWRVGSRRPSDKVSKLFCQNVGDLEEQWLEMEAFTSDS